jgi:nucleotide-binding universal stress UspA family protein
MRLVIAYDLAPDSERAIGVVARAAWPPDTVARLVTSTTGVGAILSSFAGPRETRAHARQLRASVAAAQARAAATLAGTGLTVETAIGAGSPGRTVVNAARVARADLIVAGARSQSAVAATLLGSVSAEITERARGSVLIVRVESLERVVLATDGSPAAEAATAVVARWPLFAKGSIRVVGVVPPRRSLAESILSEPPADGDAGELVEGIGQAQDLVDAALGRLADAGRRAAGAVRVGNPADEIAAAVREWPADLVVMGCSGKTLVRRLILGSVARSVLQDVRSSVLIVRP